MTTDAPVKAGIPWDAVVPTFTQRLREPKKPARPSDGAIAMAQKSFEGFKPEGADELYHVMQHRFATVEQAEIAADELKRAGSYINLPEGSTVNVNVDPEGTGDKRIVRWQAGHKRGRKT